MNDINYTIDFSTIPGIRDKISDKELCNLNEIFQKPEVIEKLKEIEVYRKKRQKAYGYVTLFMIVITLLVGYFIGKLAAAATVGIFAIIMVGIFFHVGSGDNSIGTLQGISGLGALLYGGVYMKYRSKIEIPLKRDIMSQICATLHNTFKYSYDAKYSYDDLEVLLKKKFLKKYNRLETVEDSVQLKMEKDGKGFILNGFELKTRYVSGSGKNRTNIITNHDYLMKIVFPYARIPMKNDLLVTPDIKKLTGRDRPQSLIFRILLSLLLGGIIIGFSMLFIGISFEDGINFAGIFMIGMIIFLGLLGIYWLKTRKRINKITLEDIEFEEEFDVFCDDEVTSRMILTPAFMDKLVTFVKKTGNSYSFLFTEQTVYIKRKIHKKYMEVGTSKNMFNNVSGFLEFYLDMREVLILSQELHLMYLSKTTDAVINQEEIINIPIVFNNNSQGIFSLFGKKNKNKQSAAGLI